MWCCVLVGQPQSPSVIISHVHIHPTSQNPLRAFVHSLTFEWIYMLLVFCCTSDSTTARALTSVHVESCISAVQFLVFAAMWPCIWNEIVWHYSNTYWQVFVWKALSMTSCSVCLVDREFPNWENAILWMCSMSSCLRFQSLDTLKEFKIVQTPPLSVCLHCR